MGATKHYFREQFRTNKIKCEHEDASDFYLSCWQSGFSCVPLLCFRLILFLGCLGILISTVILAGPHRGYFPIFLTNWGVMFITVSTGLAFLVSLMAQINGTIDTSLGLPWYVKLYWLSYCISVPLSFFITIFHYSFLGSPEDDEEIEHPVNPIVDLFVHAVNAVVMLCLLWSARQPLHLLQAIYPCGLIIIYLIFSIIYYFAGGIGTLGEPWIYPMLDWREPGPTIGLAIVAITSVVFLHCIVVGMTHMRGYVTKRCARGPNTDIYYNN